MTMKANPKPNALRVATYSRYSSTQQRETSIEDQQRNCHARARAEGWVVVRDFADAAISGSDSSRPQYQAMIAAAKRHEFDVLLLDDLSRLTRDSMEQEKTIRTLEFVGGCNVRIVSTSDGYDSLHGGRKVHRGMKGMMNEIFLDDLAAKVHRGQRGQAERKFWNGGKPYGFKLKPITDPSRLDPYGAPARIGTVLVIDAKQAAIVKEIFTRYAAGESANAIAADLNARKVPSAGSTWRRVVRRADKWVSSSVRAILVNPLHTGRMRWNASQFVKNPETGKHERHNRPESEHVVNQIESLRIVSDALWARAEARRTTMKDGDSRLKQGGKVRYLLSGLMHCADCKASYVIADKYSYGCSSFLLGGRAACANDVRVNRKSIEATILGPVIEALKSPERVKAMAAMMQREYGKRIEAQAARASTIPRELRALDERLAKLRAMPGLTEDERQVLIDKAEAKRRELQAAKPEAKAQAKILTLLPRAAATYLQLIEEGLAGNARWPDERGSLWATYYDNPWALVRDTAV
jgi:site-specific DNA recombinase